MENGSASFWPNISNCPNKEILSFLSWEKENFDLYNPHKSRKEFKGVAV